MFLTCRDSKGSPEVLGGFNDQRAESSQLSSWFCPAALGQVSHCWEDSTQKEIELHVECAAARKVFPPWPCCRRAVDSSFPNLSQSAPSVHVLTRSPQQCLGGCPWAGPSPGALLSKKLPGHPVLGQAQPPVLREPKASPRAFPSQLGWSSWASPRTLSRES